LKKMVAESSLINDFSSHSRLDVPGVLPNSLSIRYFEK
jgi:hypothetical protein